MRFTGDATEAGSETLADTFERVFGSAPFRFQVRTAARLLAGSNTFLSAPTGAGKTLAALLPFVHARRAAVDFADRLIYALPQRTLAAGLHESVRDLLANTMPQLRVAIQTGAAPEDPYFEADITFATIDQVLSAYVGVPASLPTARANIPAGALLGAYLVFDEYHLLEPGRALATALDLARRHGCLSRMLFMTATAPDALLGEAARRAGAVPMSISDEELERLPSQSDVERTLEWRDAPLTAAAVLGEHRGRTAVVVNTVARAQTLYEELRARGAEDCLLLHSRFLPADRARTERELLERFRPGGSGGLLVATQVIEVGLDISAETLLTELAPASSLVQRAGRCARFAGESGRVLVHDLEQGDRGPRYGPYEPHSFVVDATKLLLRTPARRGGTMPRRRRWSTARTAPTRPMGSSRRPKRVAAGRWRKRSSAAAAATCARSCAMSTAST